METIDYEGITQIQQKVWSEGDFAMVGGTIVLVAENLAEALDIRPDEQVLDVACGAGNGAIAAARRSWTQTVGLDYVPALLERGRERAQAERLDVSYVEGDAQALPFEEGSFDVVMSIFGAMFAPDQEKTAAELLRVCRPGGRIGMCNWTPEGYAGQMFATVGKHVPPPPGIRPPSKWGTEERLREVFGDGIASLEVERRIAVFRFRSTDHWLDFFRTYFGPIKVAFERVGPEGEEALAADLIELVEDFNEAEDGERISGEYLEAVATRA